jgi:hypothetical protein
VRLVQTGTGTPDPDSLGGGMQSQPSGSDLRNMIVQFVQDMRPTADPTLVT